MSTNLGGMLTGGLGPALYITILGEDGDGPGREVALTGFGGDPEIGGSTETSPGSAVWVARKGDPSDHGGEITEGCATTVKTNGIDTAKDGCLHVCPIDGHGTTPVTATARHEVEGDKIVRVGDQAGCGARISKGSPNVASK